MGPVQVFGSSTRAIVWVQFKFLFPYKVDCMGPVQVFGSSKRLIVWVQFRPQNWPTLVTTSVVQV
jgi:hypothetical protein